MGCLVAPMPSFARELLTFDVLTTLSSLRAPRYWRDRSKAGVALAGTCCGDDARSSRSPSAQKQILERGTVFAAL